MADELPDLLAAISDRLGKVVLIGYHGTGWDETPLMIEIAGQSIELLRFTSDEPARLIVIDEDGRHITLQVIAPSSDERTARRAFGEFQRREAITPAAAGPPAATWSVDDVAEKLTQHEGSGDQRRAEQIRHWCDEVAQQFADAPVQTFIPILVEHIVRDRMIKSRRAAKESGN